ncbi:ATP-binding protein [Streptomyces sp. HK10]|uniref:ATP-binding protein n=1 Tax=Streptomyces sp. HK10 TaxID=3373255 RepID=UPI00374A2CBE
MTEQLPTAGVVLKEDRLDYTPFPSSVSLARRRTARLVGEWGYPGVAGDASLIVSELAGNALLHGRVLGRPFRVHLMLTASVLRIEVSDACGERRPEPRTPADDEQFGRGLLIVDALVARWGANPRTVGETVWAEIDLGRTRSG